MNNTLPEKHQNDNKKCQTTDNQEINAELILLEYMARAIRKINLHCQSL